MGRHPAGGAARGRARAAELCRLCARRRARRGDGHRGQGAGAVLRAAAGDRDRARRAARRAQCRFPERGQRQCPRIRRHASGNGDAPGGAGRAGPVRAGRAASGVRPRPAARVYSRGRDLVPRRARRDADALPARLAHHRDLRDFRGGGGLRPPARARCAADRLGARPCRDAIRQPRRKPRQHGEKPRGRQRREKRAGRGAVRRGRVYRTRSSRSKGATGSRR